MKLRLLDKKIKTNEKNFPIGTLVKMTKHENNKPVPYLKGKEITSYFGYVSEISDKGEVKVCWEDDTEGMLDYAELKFLHIYQPLSKEDYDSMCERYPEGACVKLVYDGCESANTFTDYESFHTTYGVIDRVNPDGSVDVFWDKGCSENIPFAGNVKIEICDRHDPMSNDMVALIAYLCGKTNLEGAPDVEGDIFSLIRKVQTQFPQQGYRIIVFSKTLLEDTIFHEQTADNKERLADIWTGFAELYKDYYFMVTDNFYPDSFANPIICGRFGEHILDYSVKNIQEA